MLEAGKCKIVVAFLVDLEPFRDRIPAFPDWEGGTAELTRYSLLAASVDDLIDSCVTRRSPKPGWTSLGRLLASWLALSLNVA